MRKIIHVDMDAFYASIEQRDNKNLRGIPIAVGHQGDRGVVSTASYEARRFGVRSAMPSLIAMKKCPQLTFVEPRFEVYHEVSEQVRNIFLTYTDLVEPLSLDEAFLDVTTNFMQNSSASLIAKEIQKKIFDQTQLTASAGVSFNKFLAKVASEFRKPNGIFVVTPKDADQFVRTLPIEKFFGVGKVTAQRMYQLGVRTGGDLRKFTKEELTKHFGKAGLTFYDNARGIDYRPVQPDRPTRSISNETTFEKDKDSIVLLGVELYHLANEVFQRIQEENFHGKTVTLKIKYEDFRSVSRSKTLQHYISDRMELVQVGKRLLENIDLSKKKVRLIGIGVSNSVNDIDLPNKQLMFDFY